MVRLFVLLVLVALLAPPLAAARVLPPLRETAHDLAVAAEGTAAWAVDAALDPVQGATASEEAAPPARLGDAPQASPRAAGAPGSLVAWPWVAVEAAALFGVILTMARGPLARVRRAPARWLRALLLLALAAAGAGLALVQVLVHVEPAFVWVAAGLVAWVALLAGAHAVVRATRPAPAFRLSPPTRA